MRAKKFGMPLSEAAKKEARLARFNTNNQNDKSAASIKTPVVRNLLFILRFTLSRQDNNSQNVFYVNYR